MPRQSWVFPLCLPYFYLSSIQYKQNTDEYASEKTVNPSGDELLPIYGYLYWFVHLLDSLCLWVLFLSGSKEFSRCRNRIVYCFNHLHRDDLLLSEIIPGLFRSALYLPVQ